MLGPKIGMGPMVAQDGRFNKCDLTKIENCPDSCCAIVACRLCLYLMTYQGEFWGFASYQVQSNSYQGTVNGREFLASWQRDEYDLCEFVVIFDGEEVFREPLCYGGLTCEDPSGSAYVDGDGVLEWTVHENRPVPYVVDPETGCMINFCGACECAPKELCATITKMTGTCREVLEDINYSCDGPVWEGTIPCEPYDIFVSLTLSRDPYTGNCMLGGTYDNEVLEDKVVVCPDIGTEWILPDDAILSVRPKYCDCDIVYTDCCSPRCPPLEVVSVDSALVEMPGSCDDPLPVELQIDVFGSSDDGGDPTCFNGSGVLIYRTPISSVPGVNCWDGWVSGSCTDCFGNNFPWSMRISVCCMDTGRFLVSYYASYSPCTGFSFIDHQEVACSPMLLEGCFDRITNCSVGCLYDVTPIPSPTYGVCYQIYEMP